MAAAARKKALVLSLTLATVSVEKKVSERRKYGMSDRSIFESEKEEDDFQPTKKHHTKPSVPKRKLKRYCWKSNLKGICSENTDDTVGSFDVQWIVSRAKSA